MRTLRLGSSGTEDCPDIILVVLQVGAPARVGLVAPCDVTVPAGNTGLDPSSTNFFQVRALTLSSRVVAKLLCCTTPLCLR